MSEGTIELTAVIQIGNSDDKLTQSEWSTFVGDLYDLAHRFGQIHFFGLSDSADPWQNACAVVAIFEGQVHSLRASLGKLAGQHRQDSIALTIGPTEFRTAP